MGIKGKNSYTIEDELLDCDSIFNNHERAIVWMISLIKKMYPNGRKPCEPLKKRYSTIGMDLIDELKAMESSLDFEYALIQKCIKENKLSSSKRTAESIEIYCGHVTRYYELKENGHDALRTLNMYKSKNEKQL